MKYLRSAIHWAAAWLVFVAGATLLVIASFFLGRERFFSLVQPWCRALVRAAGIRIQVTGSLDFMRYNPCVVVAPHISLLDPLVFGAILPRPVPGVELETHFRWPLYGRIIKALGHIPISHSKPARTRKSLRAVEDHLAAGHPLLVFPEGHRTRDGKRQPFGLWIFRAAARQNIPVIPVRFVGAFDRLRTGSFLLNPGVWEIQVLNPIYPAGPDRTDAEELRRRTAEVIDNCDLSTR